jgi:hypothetical protein
MAEPNSKPNSGNGGVSVSVTAPGGGSVSVRGRDTALILVILAALVWTVYATTRGFDRLETAAVEQRSGRQGAVAEIARDHRALLCILALPQEERKNALRAEDVCAWLLGSPTRRTP